MVPYRDKSLKGGHGGVREVVASIRDSSFHLWWFDWGTKQYFFYVVAFEWWPFREVQQQYTTNFDISAWINKKNVTSDTNSPRRLVRFLTASLTQLQDWILKPEPNVGAKVMQLISFLRVFMVRRRNYTAWKSILLEKCQFVRAVSSSPRLLNTIPPLNFTLFLQLRKEEKTNF